MSDSHSPPYRLIELRKHRRATPPPGLLLSFSAITRPGHDDEEIEGDGSVVNLSPGGCMIITETSLTLARPYRLILQLPFIPTPISIQSATVRWIGRQTFGFKFEDIQEAQEEQLRAFLHQLRTSGS